MTEEAHTDQSQALNTVAQGPASVAISDDPPAVSGSIESNLEKASLLPPKSRWDDLPETSGGDDAERRPRSAEEKCPICLGPIANKSVTDGCSHEFCYVCILEWSKVKAECPLCKTKFQKIRHSFRSAEEFEEYDVPPPPEAPRYRYRRATTGERYELLSEIRRLQTQIMLAQTRSLTGQNHNHQDNERDNETIDPSSRLYVSRRRRDYTRDVLNSGPQETIDHFENYRDYVGMARNLHRYRQLYQASRQEPRERLIGAPDFRRLIYERGLRVQPSEEDERRSGFIRIRDTSPEFYAENPAQITRLVPWLDRELRVLLQNDVQRVHIVTQQICQLITRFEIRSTMMHMRVGTVLFNNTEHFLYEFYHFARSPCQTLEEYDRQCHYQQGIVNGLPVASQAREGIAVTSSEDQPGTSNTTNSVNEGSASGSMSSRRSQEDIQVVEERPAPMNPALLYPDIRIPFHERSHPEPIRDPNIANTGPFDLPSLYPDFILNSQMLQNGQFDPLGSNFGEHINGSLFPAHIFPPGFRERRKRALQEKIDRLKKRKKRAAMSQDVTRAAAAAAASAAIDEANDQGGLIIPRLLSQDRSTPIVDLTEEDESVPDSNFYTFTPPPIATGESTDSAENSRSPPIHVRSNTPEDIQRLRSLCDSRRDERAAKKRQADFAQLVNHAAPLDEEDSMSDPDIPGPSWKSAKATKTRKTQKDSSGSSKAVRENSSSHLRFLSSDSGESDNSSEKQKKQNPSVPASVEDSRSAPGPSRVGGVLTDDQVSVMARHLGLTTDSGENSQTSTSFNVTSDSEENDELEVICEMPPKHLRTPPIVTLDDEEAVEPVTHPIVTLPETPVDSQRRSEKHRKHKKSHKRKKSRRRDSSREREKSRRSSRRDPDPVQDLGKFNGASSGDRPSKSPVSSPKLRSVIGEVKGFLESARGPEKSLREQYTSKGLHLSPKFPHLSQRYSQDRTNSSRSSNTSKRRSRSNPC